jgi:hypothetical protein
MSSSHTLCRNCNHIDWLHVKTYYYHCGRTPSFDEYYFDDHRICPCQEYVPKDNLEYLEWCLAKKREVLK